MVALSVSPTSPTFQIEAEQIQETLNFLETVVTPERVSVAAADRAQHATDQSSHPPHLPDLVIWPQSTAEVSAILRYANGAGIPVTAWGAGTSIEGNPIPLHGGIVLDFRQMTQILAIHENDFQVTVQPGLLYKDMNRTLARHGLFFAPDPGANASIGGMVANNAAGIRTVKYGATRDNVLALEVVLANGDVIQTGSRSVKQSSGYDLTHLFIGSEGTLGIVTAATLKLAPLPEHFSAVIAAFPTVEVAAQVVFEIIGSGLGPAALELLDTGIVAMLNAEEGAGMVEAPHLLLEFDGFSRPSLQETLATAKEICVANGCQHYQDGVGREERNQLWALRHRLFEVALRAHPDQTYYVGDVAVPISQYPNLIAYVVQTMADFEVQGMIVGHAGDGNIHLVSFFPPEDTQTQVRVQQVNDLIVEKALSLSGTITGEHGVGLGKQKYMLREHGAEALTLMRQLKMTLDPNGILNPGKVLALPEKV